MLRRVLSAVAMVPILIGAIVYPHPSVFQALALLFIGAALYEYFGIVWPAEPRTHLIFGTMVGMGYAFWWMVGAGGLVSGLLVSVVLVWFGFLFFAVAGPIEASHHRLGHLILGVLYVAGFGSHIVLLRALPDGVFWTFALLAATWFNDTLAYFVGHLWGRHRLAPALSPSKTWEGWGGGLVGSAIGIFFFRWILPNPLSTGEALGLALLAGLVGPIGDISESLLKRSVGVKDSGHLIPGHGGVLDRIDALLFNGPLFYYFALWVVA